MGKNRKTNREFKSTLDAVKESSRIIAKNTAQTNEKLADMKSDIGKITESSTSKLPVIIAIIAVLVTFSGVSVMGIYDKWKSKTQSDVETLNDESEEESKYKIYLYSEYSTFNKGMKIEMTASLNFEADAVNITAHLASGGEGTVSLARKNETEWQKKVEFTEVGIHEIVVSATAPNGEVVENSIEVEVTPVSIDMESMNQLFTPGWIDLSQMLFFVDR